MNDRDLAAARIHQCTEQDESGWCWGPTPADYATADAEALLIDKDAEVCPNADHPFAHRCGLCGHEGSKP